jgi:anaerobic ribonucleoside-triphosphate reductase
MCSLKKVRYNSKTFFSQKVEHSKCSKCGKVHSTKTDVCPDCGCDNLGHFTRTIGYFTPVDSWSKIRREWEFPRRKFIDDSLMN